MLIIKVTNRILNILHDENSFLKCTFKPLELKKITFCMFVDKLEIVNDTDGKFGIIISGV